MANTPLSSIPPPSLTVNQEPSGVVATREVIDVSIMPATAVPTVASLNFKNVKFNDVVITEEVSYPIAKIQ